MAALAAAALFATLPVACTDDPDDPADPADTVDGSPLSQSGDMPIYWDVKEVSSPSDATRVMVGADKTDDKGNLITSTTDHNNPNFYVTLDKICAAPKTADEKYDRESGFAIGLFGDYTYKNEKDEVVTVYDFYRGDRLVYLPDAPEKPSRWDTNVAMKYWRPGATYIFSAYYPQRLYNYTVSTSTATSLALVYPSRKLQYDLLFGVKRVDTNDPKWNGSEAVKLEMKHALAALRFEFQLNFLDADLLTSVYLLNDEERHFFSQGTAIFGKQLEKDDAVDVIEKKLSQVEWKQDYNPPADEILYKWVPPLKYWYSVQNRTGRPEIELGGTDKNDNGVIDKGLVEFKDDKGNTKKECETDEMTAEEMLALWSYGTVNGITAIGEPEDNPVLMVTNALETAAGENEPVIQRSYHPAKSYYGMEQYYDTVTKKWVSADPEDIEPKYSNVAYDGKIFCRNSGWLLIPPQESFGKLTLCFTTKKGGRTVYKVNLPQLTGTRLKEDGTIAKFSVKNVAAGTETLPEGTDVWAASYRYTYLVTISESNLAINVSIKEWNERKHSTEIIF